MGIQRTEVVLEPGQRGQATFLPGETVRGALLLKIGGGSPHKLTAACVKLRGKASTSWKTGSGDNETHHWAEEPLLRQDISLLKEPTALPPGQHQLPFSFILPARLPHSQKYTNGKVVYECKARARSSSLWSFDGRAKGQLTVTPHRDLRREPALARHLTTQREPRMSLLRRDPGLFRLSLPRLGFATGEVIDVSLDGPERAFEVLAAAKDKVQLKARMVFRAGRSTTQSKRVLAETRPGGSPAAWRHLQLTVPAGEVTMDDASLCRIISVTHYVKVRDIHLAVTLGTIPLPPS